MSKKLIAGLGTVAALGIAALPAAGVFANNETSETIVRVRVIESVQCFTTADATADNFVWFGEVPVGVTASKNFTASGSTNSDKGFIMTGTPTDLDAGHLDVADNVRGTNEDFTAWSGSVSQGTPNAIEYSTTAGDGKWWVTTTEQSGVQIGSTIVLTGNGTDQEDSFSLTANVRPDHTNQPDVYQGYINWVCSVKSN